MNVHLPTIMVDRINHVEFDTKLVPLVQELQSKNILEASLTLHVGKELHISDPVQAAFPILGLIILVKNDILILKEWDVSLDGHWGLPDMTLRPGQLTGEFLPVS
jgi:hypothetical protein